MLKRLIMVLLLVGTIVLARSPAEVITMSTCDPDSNNVVVTFVDSYVRVVEIVDTGSCLIYIKGLDVYYLTKRDTVSRRIDGELFDYVKHKCIKRK